MTNADDAQVLLLQAELNSRPRRPEWMDALAERLLADAIDARKTLAAMKPAPTPARPSRYDLRVKALAAIAERRVRSGAVHAQAVEGAS